jgi:hypothetical protein
MQTTSPPDVHNLYISAPPGLSAIAIHILASSKRTTMQKKIDILTPIQHISKTSKSSCMGAGLKCAREEEPVSLALALSKDSTSSTMFADSSGAPTAT